VLDAAVVVVLRSVGIGSLFYSHIPGTPDRFLPPNNTSLWPQGRSSAHVLQGIHRLIRSTKNKTAALKVPIVAAVLITKLCLAFAVSSISFSLVADPSHMAHHHVKFTAIVAKCVTS
jgi:hypothetical protein